MTYNNIVVGNNDRKNIVNRWQKCLAGSRFTLRILADITIFT